MRRFIFICVALIAFAATNASGTGQPPTTDELQTFQVDNVVVQMPALNSDYVFEIRAVNANRFIMQTVKVAGLFEPVTYHNPDYGLCSLIPINYSLHKNYDIGYSINKLHLPIVQLE